MTTTPFDYDDDPERYRRGMRQAGAHASASLYDRVAAVLADAGARQVLDVGCGEGPLARALPADGPHVVGLDASATMLRSHPAPAVRADATALPFRGQAFDAVVAVNVLDHLPDPLAALREAGRVLTPDGLLVVATTSRHDAPELSGFWRPTPTSFDAEDAPGLVAEVFAEVDPQWWDAPLLTLPDQEAVRDFLLTRHAPRDAVEAAAAALPTPLKVTKRGVLVRARGPRR